MQRLTAARVDPPARRIARPPKGNISRRTIDSRRALTLFGLMILNNATLPRSIPPSEPFTLQLMQLISMCVLGRQSRFVRRWKERPVQGSSEPVTTTPPLMPLPPPAKCYIMDVGGAILRWNVETTAHLKISATFLLCG